MSNPLDIIAEAAQGFEGDPRQAALLVMAAAAAGADAVKFQLVYADELATPEYKYFPLFRNLEMSDSAWEDLASLAKDRGIRLDLDIFGARSLALAEKLGGHIKLHGTDISNLGFLDQVAASRVGRVVLGAGGATLDEITTALGRLEGKNVVLMLGFQGYPTETADNQVARVAHLSRLLANQPGVLLGFGDHCTPESGFSTALSAAALGAGARVLEKHITLGRNMQLEDHESALNPDEFGHYVATMRAADAAMGQTSTANDFGMSASEQGYRKTIRRHVVAAHDLVAAQVLTASDIVLKRSDHTAPLTDPVAVVGRRLAKPVAANKALGEDDLA